MLNKTAEQQTDIRVSIRDAAVRGQALELPINDFLFAESVRNDIIVHYKQQDTVASQTFRLTIAELMQQLPYDNIFQCHRSFVVNLNNITNAKGNSNGYVLTLSPVQEAVPVSRSYVAKLKTFL
jgi:lytTr DNA-binding domain protein